MPLSDGVMHTPSGPIPAGFSASFIANVVLTGVNQRIDNLAITGNKRKAFTISNPSLANFVDLMLGSPAVVGQGIRLGCLGVGANAGYHRFSSAELGICHTGSIQVIGTAGQSINIIEWSY